MTSERPPSAGRQAVPISVLAEMSARYADPYAEIARQFRGGHQAAV
jgi:hypothetical protein